MDDGFLGGQHDGPPRLRVWGEVLAAALDARAPVVWGPQGSEPPPASTLVVQLRWADQVVAFHLGKRCAAAIVAHLLRRGEGLERTSGPERVRAAVAEHLARTARQIVGSGIRIEMGRGSPDRSWGPLAALTLCTEKEAHLEAALRLAEQRTVALGSAVELVELELAVPLIVAVSSVPAAEIAGWGRGDLWLPAAGWLVTPESFTEEGSAPAPGGARKRAFLALADPRRVAWVEAQGGARLRYAEVASREALCAEPSPPLDTAWVEVRVSAGWVRANLGSWSTLASGDELILSDPSWTLWVDGVLTAYARPCRWEETWALELTAVISSHVGDS